MRAMRKVLLFGFDVIGDVTSRAAGEKLADHGGAERTRAAGYDHVAVAEISHGAILACGPLKIRATAVGFPIAVARRLGAFGPADLALGLGLRLRRGYRRLILAGKLFALIHRSTMALACDRRQGSLAGPPGACLERE